MNIITKTAVKWQLSCCALCQITASNKTPIEELQYHIDKLKLEAKNNWHYTNRNSGERACFVIVSPGEDILEKNLINLGFKQVATFDRRNGYPKTGFLKMYFLNW